MLQPTLFIDEAGTFLPENDELRGILNSGHRRNGSVLRIHWRRSRASCFPDILGLCDRYDGKLPGTLADRSVSLSCSVVLPANR